MTETTNTDSTPPADEADEKASPEDSPEPGTDDTDADDTGTDDHPPRRNREEAYRKRAMAAETELVLAQARVAETNRERAEELAQQRMQDPSDLWANDVKLDDVLGDDKRIDRDKFDQAVTDLLTRKPHLGKRTPQTPAASTVRGEGKRPGAEAAPTWVDAFGPGQG